MHLEPIVGTSYLTWQSNGAFDLFWSALYVSHNQCFFTNSKITTWADIVQDPSEEIIL